MNDGTVAKVKQRLDVAVNFKTSRNVKLFCGEFGVYIPNSPHSDRVYWYDVVRKYLEEKGITWTTWDYQGGFGLFEKGSNELFDYDLDTEILKSLNFTIPVQSEFVIVPETNQSIFIPTISHHQFLNQEVSETVLSTIIRLTHRQANTPFTGLAAISIRVRVSISIQIKTFRN